MPIDILAREIPLDSFTTVLPVPEEILTPEVARALQEPGSRRRQSVGVVLFCTLLGAAAQILIKSGANGLPQGSLAARLLGMATSLPIIAGYSLYAVFTLLFIYALKREELSIVYPIISLTYVWVTALSVFFFGEAINPFKIAGVATIVFGVAVLGRSK